MKIENVVTVLRVLELPDRAGDAQHVELARRARAHGSKERGRTGMWTIIPHAPFGEQAEIIRMCAPAGEWARTMAGMNRRHFLYSSMALTTACAVGSSAALSRAKDAESKPMDVRQFHATRQFVNLPSARIAYIERGRGPAALFLHGYPL